MLPNWKSGLRSWLVVLLLIAYLVLTRLHFNRIHYSERYSDDEYEYRHVILPKPLFKMIPKQFFNIISYIHSLIVSFLDVPVL